jgi:lysophospholipase L1-like esterase
MPKKKSLIPSTFFLRILLALSTLALLSFAAIFTISASAAATHSESPREYLALGDSLAFGFQPDGDFTHGYVTDLFQRLQTKRHFDKLVNLGCSGETSSSFIEGNNILEGTPTCPGPQVGGSFPQLSAALTNLQQNADRTGLITLQIGANDVLDAINPANCTVQADLFNTNLATLDQNLTQIILPQLHKALKNDRGHHTRLVLVKYYDPFQQVCPNATPFVKILNDHLQNDATAGHASTVDIDDSFNGRVCDLTWMCSTSPDIHPIDRGYQVIAEDIFQQIRR